MTVASSRAPKRNQLRLPRYQDNDGNNASSSVVTETRETVVGAAVPRTGLLGQLNLLTSVHSRKQSTLDLHVNDMSTSNHCVLVSSRVHETRATKK